jgi:hypothetical protein
MQEVIVSVKPRMPKAEGEAAAPPAKEGKGAPEPPPAVGDNPFDVEPKEVVITPLTSTGTSRASSSRAT